MIIIFVISTNYNFYIKVVCFCIVTPIDSTEIRNVVPQFGILAACDAQSTTNNGATSSVVKCTIRLKQWRTREFFSGGFNKFS